MLPTLKQSTAIKVPFGPLVQAADGATAMTSVALASGEAYATKNDAAALVDISGNTWAHLGHGIYNLSLGVGDTDTLGLLHLTVHDSACRPYIRDFMVVPANSYDGLVSGTEKLNVNVNEIDTNAASGFLTGTDKLRADLVSISGTESCADNLEESTKAISTGTVQASSTTTLIKTNLTEAQNDHFNGRIVLFNSGTQRAVGAEITDYDGAAKTLTVTALPAAPANGDTFVIV